MVDLEQLMPLHLDLLDQILFLARLLQQAAVLVVEAQDWVPGREAMADLVGVAFMVELLDQVILLL